LASADETLASTDQPFASASQAFVSASRPLISANEPLISASESLISANEALISASEPLTSASQLRIKVNWNAANVAVSYFALGGCGELEAIFPTKGAETVVCSCPHGFGLP
jgi:hypothetical protein